MISRAILLCTVTVFLAGCPVGPAGKPDYLAGAKEVLSYKPIADATADAIFDRWASRQTDATKKAKGQAIYAEAKELFDEKCASAHNIIALIAAKKKPKSELSSYCGFPVATDADVRRCVHAHIAALGAALLKVALTIDDLVQAARAPASAPAGGSGGGGRGSTVEQIFEMQTW